MAKGSGDGVNIRVSVEGLNTIAKLKQELKDSNKVLSEFDIASKQFAQEAERQVAIKEKLASASRVAWTESAKMKDSYFRLGQQLRQLAMGGGSFDAVTKSFVSIQKQAGGTGQVFKGLLSMLAGPTGMIAVVTGLAFAFGDKLFAGSKKSTDEIRKHVEELRNLRFEIDEIRGGSGADARSNEEKIARAGALLAERDRLTVGHRTASGKVIEASMGEEALKRMRDINRELLEIERDLAQAQKDQTAEIEKRAEIIRKATLEASGKMGLPPTGVAQEPGTLGLPIFGGGRGPLPGSEGVDVTAAIAGVKRQQEELRRARREGEELSRSLEHGFASATSILEQGFVQAFGLGQSLADKLVASLISSLFGLLFNLITGGIWGLVGRTIPTVSGGGRGGSGGSSNQIDYPEIYIGGGRSRAGGGEAQIVIENRVTPDGLATAVRRGNRILAQRSI